jgi:hypothetical protein
MSQVHSVTHVPVHSALADYFDACRRKRNVIDYSNSSVATDTEADEILLKANEPRLLVERWVAANRPLLST